MHIFGNGLLNSKKNQGAFQGPLCCPYCQSQKNKFVEKLNGFRWRYRCGACKQTFQYDVSGIKEHPYAPFKKKQLFQAILERSKSGQSR